MASTVYAVTQYNKESPDSGIRYLAFYANYEDAKLEAARLTVAQQSPEWGYYVRSIPVQ